MFAMINRNDKSAMWGFLCSVVGYEWQETGGAIRLLETELAYLGGMCAASLMKRDLPLKSTSGKYLLLLQYRHLIHRFFN